MNVGRINCLSFKNRYDNGNFYNLSQSQKLDKIYEKLNDIERGMDVKTYVITSNQNELNYTNNKAFQILAENNILNDTNKKDLISDVFERSEVKTYFYD